MTERTPACLSQDAWLVEALKGKQGYGKGYASKRRTTDRAIGILIHGNRRVDKTQELAFRVARKRPTKPVLLLDTEFGICHAAEVRHRDDTPVKPEDREQYQQTRDVLWGALYGRK